MSDTQEKAFDPTESTRTLTSDLYTEQKMTLREHQDTDKHYIGDSLPVPSNSQVVGTGTSSSAGSSPFPARADHSHDTRMLYGLYGNSAALTIAPGQSFINNLTFTGWGKNMLASGQIIAFPTPGVYHIHLNVFINRVGGGLYQNDSNIVFFYTNGSYARTVDRRSNFDLGGSLIVVATDVLHSSGAPSANDNVQFAIQQADVVNWTVSVQLLQITRLCGITSA